MSIVGVVATHPVEVIAAWVSGAVVAVLFVAGGSCRRAHHMPARPDGERLEA